MRRSAHGLRPAPERSKRARRASAVREPCHDLLVIVRDAGQAWQVVLQTDHADLAADFAAAWAEQGPRHDSVVLAARRHDDGWATWERSPLVDPASRPVNFLDVHVPAHLAFYRAGITATSDEDGYAGLLVSMHGTGIYRQRYGSDPGLSLTRAVEVEELVEAFVAEQEATHPARLEEAGVPDELRWEDYHRLQWYDRFSLAFCMRDWDEPGDAFELGPFRFEPLGPWRARIAPYPFADPMLSLSLLRRLVPKRDWTQPEFRDWFDATPAARVGLTVER